MRVWSSGRWSLLGKMWLKLLEKKYIIIINIAHLISRWYYEKLVWEKIK